VVQTPGLAQAALRSGQAGEAVEDKRSSHDDVETGALADHLSRHGSLGSAKIPDLLVATTTEGHGVTVIHYDTDFDRIAEVTGQPTEWVVPAGTVP
jgi:predicted nucleic acid-binding protein